MRAGNRAEGEADMALRGLQFRRRIRVLPGLRLNLSKSGLGFSVGGRGAHIGISGRGQRYVLLGLLGSGLSCRTYASRPPRRPCPMCAPGHVHLSAGWVVFTIAAGFVMLVLLAR